MDLIIKVKLNQDWVADLKNHPMIRKNLTGFILTAVNASLVGRGKVLSVKIDEEK
jgi:hypothetical protein